MRRHTRPESRTLALDSTDFQRAISIIGSDRRVRFLRLDWERSIAEDSKASTRISNNATFSL